MACSGCARRRAWLLKKQAEAKAKIKAFNDNRVERGQGSAHSRGYGQTWRNIRTWILRRDKHLCQTCKAAGRLTPATEVDHIINKAQGGTDHPDNLQAICHRCHGVKTQAESRGSHGTVGCDSNGIPRDPAHHWYKS